jgi:hypothetical protein
METTTKYFLKQLSSTIYPRRRHNVSENLILTLWERKYGKLKIYIVNNKR